MHILSIIGQGRSQLVRYKLTDDIARCRRFPASAGRKAIIAELALEEPEKKALRPGKSKSRRVKQTRKSDNYLEKEND